MPAVADAVAGALLEASFGGLVKCPECKTLNGKSSAKCKSCGHDMKQVAAKAKSDGRSNVKEAVTAVLETKAKDDDKAKGSGRRKMRTRRGKFADLATAATGKRAVPDAPAAKGSAESSGPTSVAEADAWGGKPGANWKQVTPKAKAKLSGILDHYKGKAHPFTSCVTDNTKRFGAEGAKKVCAVVKDLNEKTTKWRKGDKTQEAELATPVIAVALCEAAGVDDDAGVELLCEALMERLPPLERVVLESLQEARQRGGNRAVELKRLSDGTFAPKGRGTVLKPGDTAKWSNNGKDYTGTVQSEVPTTPGSAPQFRIKTKDSFGDDTTLHVPVSQPQTKPDLPGAGGAGDEEAEVTAAVQSVLPGANVRKTKDGYQVGGFSKPPAEAQRMLRAAGLDVTDSWGATMVKPKRSVREAVLEALA